jgi:hypothetical protein
MYWWNVAKLAEDFREGRVEEKERFKYFLATSIVWCIGAQPFFYYGSAFKIADLIYAAVGLTVTISGTVLCYRANRSGDNSDFIGRMICLSWPISIMLAVTILIGTFLFLMFQVLINVALGSDFAYRVSNLGREVVGGLFLSLYYWLAYKYINILAHPKAPAARRLTSPVESLEV